MPLNEQSNVYITFYITLSNCNQTCRNNVDILVITLIAWPLAFGPKLVNALGNLVLLKSKVFICINI